MKHNLKGFPIQWMLTAVLLLLTCLTARGQQFGLGRSHILDPITWKATVEGNSTASATIRLTAQIEDGWHLYSLNLPPDGPNSTVIDFQVPDGVKLDGPLTPSRKPVEKYDDMFSLNLSWWEGDVTFTQKVKISDEKTHTVGIEVSFQGCNDETCIAPKTEYLEVSVGTGPAWCRRRRWILLWPRLRSPSLRKLPPTSLTSGLRWSSRMRRCLNRPT